VVILAEATLVTADIVAAVVAADSMAVAVELLAILVVATAAADQLILLVALAKFILLAEALQRAKEFIIAGLTATL
jgi:hypothetical protein